MRLGWTVATAALAGLLLAFLVVPLAALVLGTSPAELAAGLRHPLVGPALRLSLVTTVVSLGLVLLTGTPLAWLLARRPGRIAGLVESAVQLPMVVPPAVAGIVLLLAFGRMGALGRWLDGAGLPLAFSTAAVVLAQVFVSAPFYVLAATAGFRRLDERLLVVARTLGASPARVFLRVALPLSAPALASGAAMAWARALGEFGATLMFAGNLSGRTQTLPLAILTALESDVRAAQALSVVLVAVALVVLFVVRATRPAEGRAGGGVEKPRVGVEARVNADANVFTAHAEPAATAVRSSAAAFAATPAAAVLEADLEAQVGALPLTAALSSAGGPLVLVGPNGSGKTSLLACLLGVIRPRAGRLVLGGRVLFDAARGIDVPTEARGIGYVPQAFGLFPHLTALGNVTFGLPAGLRGRARRDRAQGLLADLGVAHTADRRPDALSGGEQQRVALARALAAEPAALLLDEPLAALDVGARRQVRAFLAERLAALRIPTLLVTHDPADARALGQRIAVIEAGAVVQAGSWAALEDAPATDFVAELVGDALPQTRSSRPAAALAV